MAYSAARYFAPTYFSRYFVTGSSEPEPTPTRDGDGGRFRGRLKRKKQENYNSARIANYERQQGERDYLKVLLGEAPRKGAAKPAADPQKRRNNVIDMALIMALLEDGDE